MNQEKFSGLYKFTLMIQGLYYLLTALWPLIDIDSFMDVSGPKTDVWLVKTVSVLLLCISVFLISAGIHKRFNVSVAVFAASLTVGLTVIDIYYSITDVIWNVYR